MKDANSSNDQTKAGLNLGLAELISAPEPEKSASLEDKSNSHAKQALLGQTPQAVQEEESRFEKLYRQGAWSELASISENHASDQQSEQFEAKLWWILSQLRQSSMPLSILSAPLDSVSRSVLDADLSGRPVLKKLCGELLLECGQKLKEQGETSLACVFLERSARFGAAAPAVLGQALDSEIQKLTKSRSLTKNEAEKQRLEELRRLQNDLKPLEESFPKTQSSKAGSLRTAIYVSTMLSLILLLSIAYFRFIKGAESTSNPHEILTLASSVQDRSLALPLLQPLNGLGRLDALYYQLGPEARGAQLSSAAASAQNVSAPALPKKEVIDTSYPLKSSEPEPVLKEKAESRNISLERGERSRSRRAPLPVDAQPVAVEEFSAPQVFEVEADTEVMSKPSFAAVPVDRLYIGDSVRAVAQVGNWLKLRSKQGRVGYVSLDYLKPNN